MIPEAGFLLSIAGLNASFAGLGGLLIGLRRGPDLRPLEALRLRQVVEFAFANLLLAISVQPLVALLGGADAAIRLSAGLSFACILLAMPLLQRRVARIGIAWGRRWAVSAVGLSAVGALLAAATFIAPSAGLFELLLVVMLARPMVVFVLVLGSLEEVEPVTSGGQA